MITKKRLSFLEEQATISTDFAELITFLEIETYYPEIETTDDRNRIRNLAKQRIQELSKIKNVK